MKSENPFRTGDRVLFVGTERHWALRKPWPSYASGKAVMVNPPFRGVVKGIWRKNGRHMVDVEFHLHGGFCCYPSELEFDVLDTLGAM